ncbi:MAG: InlB B-repeat-containing protein [Bacillus subtilis]|nr:InlB B-repeat-containing protein [Bacillus subtilis]
MKRTLYSLFFLGTIIAFLTGCSLFSTTTIPATTTGAVYVVSFETNIETQLDPIRVNAGSSIVLPILTDGNAVFLGWALTNDASAIPFSGLFQPTQNTTLFAKWGVQDSELTIQLQSIYQLAVDANVFQGTYEEWLETVRGPQGAPGVNGKSPQLRVFGTNLQWKYTDDATWITLIDLGALRGNDGKSAYELYAQNNPDYEGSEDIWLDDLVNGRLGTSSSLERNISVQWMELQSIR